MANINGLPVFEALVDSEDTGMLRISLVDDPAVMSDFLAFAGEQRKVQRYAIADEDRHLVFGVVMRADFPIYRYDEGYGGYYIIYKAETIRRMAQKYLAEGRQNNVDLMHDGHDVKGVEMVQAFLKDTEKGVAPAGFEDIAVFRDLSAIERGTRRPTMDTFVKIAAALQLRPSALMAAIEEEEDYCREDRT